MNDDQRRGLRIKAVREAAGFSQAELCQRLNIQRNTWNQYEKGKRTPKWPEMNRFCDRTGATLDWIFRERPDDIRPTLLDKAVNRFEELVAAHEKPEHKAANAPARKKTGRN